MRDCIRLVFVFSVILIWQCGDCATLPGYQADQALPPMVASPMAKYDDVEIQRSPANQQLLPDSDLNELESRDINFSTALAGYAEIQGCSLDEAFAATVRFLKMAEISDPSAKSSSARAIFQVKAADTYRITASKQFFQTLPGMLKQIECGLKVVVVEVRFFSLPTANIELIHDFIESGSYQTFANQLPQATPIATAASFKDEQHGKPSSANSAGTFVSSSTTKTKTFPTFMASLDPDGVKSMIQSAKGDARINVVQAPTITAIPGQIATVNDSAIRPFVVGVDRVEGDFSVAHQPIIQPVEDGTIVRLKATREQGQIRLAGDLAFCKVESVETFQYRSTGQNGVTENISVQVPEQSVKQVHWSTLIESGKTVLIDPVEIRKQSRQITRGFQKKTIETEYRLMVLITPRLIDLSKQ